MKIMFSTSMIPEDCLWVVEFNGSIRIVEPKTHRYIIGIFPMSDEGLLLLPINQKEVYIDRQGNINITGWAH